MEKFTSLAKILHCRRQRRHGQIPPLSVNDGNDAIADHFQLNWFVLSVGAQECIHCLKAWRSPIHSLR